MRTVQPPDDWTGRRAYLGEGPAINSANDGLDLNGMGVADAKAAMIAWLEAHGHGRATTTYRLRDWLFSRQRYWGEPFPIVYDETGLPDRAPGVDAAGGVAAAGRLPPAHPRSRRRHLRARVAAAGPADWWATVELDLGDGPSATSAS